MYTDLPKVDQAYTEAEECVVCITDETEIRELLELISYDSGRGRGGVFRLNPVDRVTIVLKEEQKVMYVNIPYGALPEKYILRFGDL